MSSPTTCATSGATRRLGKNERDLLRTLACPGLFLVVGNKEARSLAAKGLLAPRGAGGDGLYQITPAGLRRVADEIEAGRMVFPMPAPKGE